MQNCAAQGLDQFTGQSPNDHVIHIYFDGELAEKYGTYLRVYGQNTGDAIACIAANCPDFAQETRYVDICLRQFNDGVEIIDHTLSRSITELHITPMVSGSGGFGKLLIGAALIGASFFVPGGALLGIPLQALIRGVGLALALRGIGDLLAPKPKENETSYIFSSTGTPAKQGDPIPIPLGLFYYILNPFLISGAVDTELIAVNSGSGKFGK